VAFAATDFAPALFFASAACPWPFAFFSASAAALAFAFTLAFAAAPDFPAMAAFSFATLAVAVASAAVCFHKLIYINVDERRKWREGGGLTAVTACPDSNSSTASCASAAASSPFAPLLAASLTPCVKIVSMVGELEQGDVDLQEQRRVDRQRLHLHCCSWRGQRRRVSLWGVRSGNDADMGREMGRHTTQEGDYTGDLHLDKLSEESRSKECIKNMRFR
jgi:hypothetical protein